MSSSVVMYSSAWLEPLQSEKNLNIMPLVTSNARIQAFSGMSGSTIKAYSQLEKAEEELSFN